VDDTHPDARVRARALLMARTPAERMAMASEMSVAAREIAAAGVRAELGPRASDRDVRRGVFLRFYARDLGRLEAERIFDAIEARRGAI
jgi:hypothetical protein